MRHLNLFVLISAAMCSVLITSVQTSAGVITQWNFNTATTPSLGVGTFSGLGISTNLSSDTGSSDLGTTNVLLTGSYPSQGFDSRAEGVQFLAGTAGFKNISLAWDQKNSNTASRYWAVDYTLNGGTNWIQLANSYEIDSGSTWFNGLTADFSSVAAANNNSSFGVRILSIFAPATSDYAPTNSGSNYSGGGTARFDMVTLSGTAVPEPGTIIPMIGFCVAAMAKLRRKLSAPIA